jgi:hypothetical protein
MTSTHAHDPQSDIAAVPQLPIGALVIAMWNLLEAASDLPQPRCVTVYDFNDFSLQLEDSRAVTRWAIRFGGVLQSSAIEPRDGQMRTYVRATFDFYGIAVAVYTVIAAGPVAA